MGEGARARSDARARKEVRGGRHVLDHRDPSEAARRAGRRERGLRNAGTHRRVACQTRRAEGRQDRGASTAQRWARGPRLPQGRRLGKHQVEVMDTAAPIIQVRGIRKALCDAQRDVGGIGKDGTAKIVGKNKEGGRVEYSYQFVSTEDMLAHCREALSANGLSWELIGWDVQGPLPGFNVPTLIGTFELCHGDSGEVLTRVYKMPIASRNDADKATAGAITYLLGQATRALLLVPKVSDTDAQNDPDRRTTHHGGWHDRDEPRQERRVTPQDERGQRQAPQAGSISGEPSEKQLDAAIA